MVLPFHLIDPLQRCSALSSTSAAQRNEPSRPSFTCFFHHGRPEGHNETPAVGNELRVLKPPFRMLIPCSGAKQRKRQQMVS